jgi:hypothetical protein
MNPPRLAIMIILTLFFTDNFAQILADAGKDTAFCSDNSDSIVIGGNPTASGGVPPYQYTWYGYHQYCGQKIFASSILEDTTLANPGLIEGPVFDSVVLYVQVTDQNDSSDIDSIRLRRSSYIYCLGECRYEIQEGDSAQLGHCVSGGIQPMQYQWTPGETLSDSTVRNPWAKPNITTNYSLRITDSIGCEAISACLVSIIQTAITENISEPIIELIRRNEQIFFKISDITFIGGSFFLLDINGRTIHTASIDSQTIVLDTRQLPPGIYIYKGLSQENRILSGKILIE